MSGQEFLAQAQSVLAPLADPVRAVAMAAYMKHHFAFFGIASPARRAACKPLLRAASGLDGAAVLDLEPEKAFFIRKAIGWALRDYAHHDPAWVRQFLLEHKEKLSGLSYREAGKHL